MNEKEIEETVKAFKVYLTKVIKHSAIDYIKKIKKAKYVEILYNDIIDSIVSLSEWDNDTFFDFRESDEIKFSNEKNNKIFYTLTKMEREVLILTSEGLKDEEIALRLNTTINTVRVLRNRARTKFKKGLEE